MKKLIMNKIMALALVCSVGGIMSTAACGGTDSPTTPQKLKITVFGWGPGEEDDTSNVFVDGMPLYEGARTVRVTGSIPSQNRIVAQEVGEVSGGSIKMPQLPYGDELRLELEVRDANDEVIATGASSTFSIDDNAARRALRMMVGPINQFVPSGAVVKNSEGERVFVTSELDYRSERLRRIDSGLAPENAWLGRVGHATAATSDGKVLVVGGTPNVLPDSLDSPITMSAVYGDVQIYDPETGYFTDLNLNEDESAPQPMNRDRLSEPRAFHSVTPIGNDRFIVAGGYTVRTLGNTTQTRPVRDLELIDLSADHGKRVTVIADALGVSLQLGLPRAFHEAVYLKDQDKLLLIGGRGESSEAGVNAVISEIEIVDLLSQKVVAQRFDTGVARTGHALALLGDESIFVAGGRNADGVLKSSQIIKLNATGVDITAGPELGVARYDFGLEIIPGGTGKNVLVVGGFTALDAVTDTLELGIVRAGGEKFSSIGGQKLKTARGGISTVTLPQSGDVMVFGGRNATGATVATAERIRFNGVLASTIYEVLAGDYGSTIISRYNATYTPMSNGKILVFGGVDQSVEMEVIALDKAEFYNPYDPVGEVR